MEKEAEAGGEDPAEDEESEGNEDYLKDVPIPEGLKALERMWAGGPQAPPPPPPKKPQTTVTPEFPAGPCVLTLARARREGARFLWAPYLPLGKITVLEGDPGLGKTWLALDLSARLSRGAALPGEPAETRRAPVDIMLLNDEDDEADTLRPRLEAAGADLSRIHLLWAARPYDDGPAYRLTLDNLNYIEAALEKLKPKLVVVDPLQAFLLPGRGVSVGSAVREALRPVAQLAARAGCAFLLVRHLGKSPAERPIYRGLGPVQLAALVRSILVLGQDPGEPRRRVLAHLKSSLVPGGPSLSFAIEDARLAWEGPVEARAADLLGREETSRERSALDAAREFLRAALAQGPKPLQEILKEARNEGIAQRTLFRAKGLLGVIVERKDRTATWRLPGAGI